MHHQALYNKRQYHGLQVVLQQRQRSRKLQLKLLCACSRAAFADHWHNGNKSGRNFRLEWSKLGYGCFSVTLCLLPRATVSNEFCFHFAARVVCLSTWVCGRLPMSAEHSAWPCVWTDLVQDQTALLCPRVRLSALPCVKGRGNQDVTFPLLIPLCV